MPRGLDEVVTVVNEPSNYWGWAYRGRKTTTTLLLEVRTSYVIDALPKKKKTVYT